MIVSSYPHLLSSYIFRVQEAAKKGKLLNQYALESIMRVLNTLYVHLIVEALVLLLSSESVTFRDIFLMW